MASLFNFGPKKTAAAVARELVAGLRDGSIGLEPDVCGEGPAETRSVQEPPERKDVTVPHLFNFGEHVLSAGGKSDLLIDCSAFSLADWSALAAYAARRLPPFRAAFGVPRGGLSFAAALARHATGLTEHPDLIADDVLTTGGSMERFRDKARHLEGARPGCHPPVGVVVFARGSVPSWVTPLLVVPGAMPEPVVVSSTADFYSLIS